MVRFMKNVPKEDLQAQIRRIKRYERMMRQANQILAMGEAPEESRTKLQLLLRKLDAYYMSDRWKRDFAADEAGLLPADLKRGVLSEDGIYNLLEHYEPQES